MGLCHFTFSNLAYADEESEGDVAELEDLTVTMYRMIFRSCLASHLRPLGLACLF